MKTYRVGIIGLGRMGSTIDDERPDDLPFSIATSCRASPHLKLAAGCDLLADRREAFTARHSVKAVYADFHEMLAQEELDLVAICTPASGLQKPSREAPEAEFRGDSHADLAVAVSNAGIPMIYLEKAMASSMTRADEVRDACSKNRTILNTGVTRRFHATYHAVRDAVADGIIGEPVAAVHFAPSSLMHGHIHSIDTLSFLLGDPPIRRVRGDLQPIDLVFACDQIPFDPKATYTLEFDNGVFATTIPAGGFEFEVLGSNGSMRVINNGTGIRLRTKQGRKGVRPAWIETPFPEPEPSSAVVRCLEDLVRAHESGQPSLGNAAFTHHITEACIGVAESHRANSRWVDLPMTNRDLYIFHI